MPTSPVAGRRLAFGLITSVLVTFAVLLGVARQQPGTIAGRVTDASGTPVPGVDIDVGTAQGRRLQKVVTNVRGDYRLDMEAGEYSVTARLAGFRTQKRRNIRVESGAAVRIDFKLLVGCIEEEVTAMPRSMREAVSWFQGVARIRIEKQLPWRQEDTDAARFVTRVLQWAKPRDATDKSIVLVQECVYTLDEGGNRTGMTNRPRLHLDGEEYVAFLEKRGAGPYRSSRRPFMISVTHGRVAPDASLAPIGIRHGMRASDLMRQLRDVADTRSDEPVRKPARLPWHEVRKVDYYSLTVDQLAESDSQ